MLGVGTFFPLFLQSLLIVLTVIKVERVAGLAACSSPLTESIEKRLVAADDVLRVRLCFSFVTALSVVDGGCTEGSVSQYADDRPLAKRPKGSGDSGIMGDSVGILGGAKPA